MERTELNDWLLSADGMLDEIVFLRQWNAAHSVGDGAITPAPSLIVKDINWRRPILAASMLAESNDRRHQEVALMIGQTAIVHGQSSIVRDAGAVILTQLSNSRAIKLAESRELVAPNLQRRLGVTETLLETRRRIESSIVLNEETEIGGNAFQTQLWSDLADARWVSATAPTAAGKTFLILNWLLRETERGNCSLGVFIAPTRALVGEIEKELLSLKKGFNIPNLRVSSLPIASLADGTAPTLLVFTQERLHLFLNAAADSIRVDAAIIDEVQKLNDGMRGVILQDAIERIGRTNDGCRFVFLSPHADNPECLLQDAPEGALVASVPGGTSTVTQNLMVARQVRQKPADWTLDIVDPLTEQQTQIGQFSLHDRPAGSNLKQLSYIALALGRRTVGTLVYSNRAADAEKIAQQIYDGLSDEAHDDIDQELKDLSDFCRTTIHPKFQLVNLVKRGVAFHYGNMPTLLRSEIERLFTIGKIRFLVCTSTLIEGVNLACRTILVRGPKKGTGKPMTPQDFWNLAGRAGRWGADFQGNIICLDTDDKKQWPHGLPKKSAYPIRRETDNVLSSGDVLNSYISSRAETSAANVNEALEPVTAYLMAWYMRTGTAGGSPSIMRLPPEERSRLDDSIERALKGVEIPPHVVTAHPAISAVALQALLNSFKDYSDDPEYLLPPLPEGTHAAAEMKEVFRRIDTTVSPVFGNNVDAVYWSYAFTAIDWMRGKRLGQMISAAIERRRTKNASDIPYAAIIRDTMRLVEEVARFKAPKYLSAYMDVLKLHYASLGMADKFPQDRPYELYLEFGVSSKTMLSLIGLGLSRTSAIEMNEFLGRSELNEAQVFEVLFRGEWESMDLPRIVKREIKDALDRHARQNLPSDDDQ